MDLNPLPYTFHLTLKTLIHFISRQTPATQCTLAFFILGLILLLFRRHTIAHFSVVSGFGRESLSPMRLVMANLVHANLGHLILNAWSLQVTLELLLPYYSLKLIIPAFFITGTLIFLGSSLFYRHEKRIVCGASGAIYGLLTFCTLIKPNIKGHLFSLQIPGTIFILGLIAVTWAIDRVILKGRVGHFEHIAGAVLGMVGYIIIRG